MAIGYLQYLPIILSVAAIIAFFTAYGMAVHENHVDALFPYISDAGARPPESCVFGQFLNFAAMVAFVSMFIHYKHIKEFNITQMPSVQKLNTFSLWLSAFACIGMSMVANFQYVNSPITHMIGAFMIFGLGIAYCWVQTFISYKMRSLGMSSTVTTLTRLSLSFLATVFFLITIVGAGVATKQYNDSKNKTTTLATTSATTTTFKWNDHDAGFDDHLASTFCEWLMAAAFLFFFLTYYREFKKINVSIKIAPRDSEVFCPAESHIIT